ncbi:MAG: cellulase family glycosylhydrolase [Bacteroidetes bacterium SB0662_bin_6]|nr:cellulase family glycosylhydrolase [Bacteroidetes bacterium SB0668_bin_1]MYE04500.1 cellulase family glycosylhydrolase [Bacteroidetes bacterium SB0662_bin_6]
MKNHLKNRVRAIAKGGIRYVAGVVSAFLLILPAQGQGFFRTEGTKILDRDGNPAIIRGLGLGGWLVPEGYMVHMTAIDGGSPRTIRAQIVDLIGEQGADRFFELYRAKYVAEKDIAAIAEWGFDHIRLPMHYNLLFDPDTETFIESGFELIDTFLDWCRKYELDVILDMHAAPGAQSEHNISDSDGEARLWTEPVPYQDQLVTIWTEIARRYVDDPLIIGYDLINEPVTPNSIGDDEVQADALRALYVRLAEAIRQIDTNHILFIEGNYFATHFYKLEPPFDDNMVYAFHKYWNATDVGTINYLLDLRARNNVPLWLGESGENSNPWFYEVTRLAERYGIGWNWWTHKKIATITSPLSAPFAPGYKEVVDYLNAPPHAPKPRPSERAASEALFAMAEGLDLDSCITRPGVLAALLDPDYATLRKPFKEHPIPGIINAAEYDIGHAGATYHDTDLMRVDGQSGAGNNGYEYRNDGVDIERSEDPEGFEYNVGWMETTEWLTWTVQIDQAGIYDVEFRVAADAAGNGGILYLALNNERIGSNVPVPVTGGWQAWTSVWLRDVTLPPGEHVLKLVVRNGGFNLNRMRFTLKEATAAEQADEIPKGMQLDGAWPNPFSGEVNLAFRTDRPVRARLEMVDMLGRTVYVHAPEAFGTGEHMWSVRPDLPTGMYFSRLFLEDGERTHLLTAPVTAIP